MALKIPRLGKSNAIKMASIELNDETRKRLSDVGLKPYALAGRVVYCNGPIAVIDKGITAPKSIPKFFIYELPEVEFVDGETCMNAIGKLSTKERFRATLHTTVSRCNVVVSYTLGDRCLTFTPPAEGVPFSVPRTEDEFDSTIEKLAAMDHPFDLRYQMLTYQPAKKISSVDVGADESWRVMLFMARQSASEFQDCDVRYCGDIEGFTIAENEFVFEVFGHAFICSVPKTLLATQTKLFGMASEDVLCRLRELIVPETYRFVDNFCSVLDIDSPEKLVELLNPHI